MTRLSFPVLVLAILATGLQAQSTDDVSSFRPWRSSNSEAWRLFDRDPRTEVTFDSGFWVEVDLTPDEMGAPAFISNFRVDTFTWEQVPATVLIQLSPATPWVPVWSGDLGSHLPQISVNRPACSLRLEQGPGAPSGPTQLKALTVKGACSTRPFSPLSVTWFGRGAQPGVPAILALELDVSSGDEFALFLASVGNPPLSSPLRLDPTWAGGLLLDPAHLVVLASRPVAGAGIFRLGWTFPYDPASQGIPLGIQALVIDVEPYRMPLVFFTRAICLEG